MLTLFALIGLLKMRLTRNLHEISDDAVQVSRQHAYDPGMFGSNPLFLLTDLWRSWYHQGWNGCPYRDITENVQVGRPASKLSDYQAETWLLDSTPCSEVPRKFWEIFSFVRPCGRCLWLSCNKSAPRAFQSRCTSSTVICSKATLLHNKQKFSETAANVDYMQSIAGCLRAIQSET